MGNKNYYNKVDEELRREEIARLTKKPSNNLFSFEKLSYELFFPFIFFKVLKNLKREF